MDGYGKWNGIVFPFAFQWKYHENYDYYDKAYIVRLNCLHVW